MNAPLDTALPGVSVVHIQLSFSSATDTLTWWPAQLPGRRRWDAEGLRVWRSSSLESSRVAGQGHRRRVLQTSVTPAVLVQVKLRDPVVNGSVTLSVDQSCFDQSLC